MFWHLASRLKQARRLAGLTQQDLASATSISCATISAIENGQYFDLKLSTIGRLCKALALTPNELLGYEHSPSRSPLLPQQRQGATAAACQRCRHPLQPEQQSAGWCAQCRLAEVTGRSAIRLCEDCGEPEGHQVGDCIRRSWARGRSLVQIAQRHQIPVAALRLILDFESERAS